MPVTTLALLIPALATKHGIRIYASASFKDAWRADDLCDTLAQIEDKIELAVKHYPRKDLRLSVYIRPTSDMEPFAYVVVHPI